MNPGPPDEHFQPPQASYYQRSDNTPPMVVCPVRVVYDTQVLISPDSNMEPNQVIYCNASNPFIPNAGFFNHQLVYLNGSQNIPYQREEQRLTTPNVFPGIMPNHQNHTNFTQNRMPFIGYFNPNSTKNPTPVTIKNTNPHDIATMASNLPLNSLLNYDQNASQQNRPLLNRNNVLPPLPFQEETEKSHILKTALHEGQSTAMNTVQKDKEWKKKKSPQDIVSCGTMQLPNTHPNTIQQSLGQHNMLNQKDPMVCQQRMPGQNYSPIMAIQAMQPTRMPIISSTGPVVQPSSNSTAPNSNLRPKILTLNRVPPWILNQNRNEMRSLGTQTLPSSSENRSIVIGGLVNKVVENNYKFNPQSSIIDSSIMLHSKDNSNTKNKLESEFDRNGSAKPAAHEVTRNFRSIETICSKNEAAPCVILPERGNKVDCIVIDCKTDNDAATVKVIGTDSLKRNTEAKIKVIKKDNKGNDEPLKHPENVSPVETQNNPTNSTAIEKRNLKTVPETSEVPTSTVESENEDFLSKISRYKTTGAENINDKAKADSDVAFEEFKMEKYLKQNKVDRKKELIEKQIRSIKNQSKKVERTKKIKNKNFQLNEITASEKSEKTMNMKMKVIRNSKTVDMANNNVRSNKYCLTHVVDGYIIQESNYPFPVQKSKIENETMEETSDWSEISETVDEQKTLFAGYTPEIIKTWQTEQFVAHFQALGENRVADIFEDQELDGEALVLVGADELRTVGFADDFADTLINFMKTVKQKSLDMPLLSEC